jgi:hypothetical protein
MQPEESRRLVTILSGAVIVLVVIVCVLAAVLIRQLVSPAGVSPTPTLRPTETVLPTPTLRPTETAPATPTLRPTETVPPTPTPISSVATARQSASIYSVDSRELAVVQSGEQVTISGRSGTIWFYVRNSKGVEGFVSASRLEWSGDMQLLPDKPFVYMPPTLQASTPQTPTVAPGQLETLWMDLWPLDNIKRCEGGRWYKGMYIEGHGGNGVYTYYWDKQVVTCLSLTPGCTFEVSNVAGSFFGTFKVVSGDGQQVEQTVIVAAPDGCK